MIVSGWTWHVFAWAAVATMAIVFQVANWEMLCTDSNGCEEDATFAVAAPWGVGGAVYVTLLIVFHSFPIH